MFRSAPFIAVAALALAGCGSGDGNDSANAANAMPPSKTENGQFSVRAQGVDLKINLPPPIRRMTEGDDYLYPGARSQRGGSEGRPFHSDDLPATVAAWYRAPARANRFSIDSVTREGTALILTGWTVSSLGMRVRLTPGAQGGTDGMLSITSVD
jgi:hypothetical protein